MRKTLILVLLLVGCSKDKPEFTKERYYCGKIRSVRFIGNSIFGFQSEVTTDSISFLSDGNKPRQIGANTYLLIDKKGKYYLEITGSIPIRDE